MVKLSVHHAGNGLCSLTGKEGDGIAVSFEDSTVVNQFLSWKAFRQLLSLKFAQANGQAKPPPTVNRPAQPATPQTSMPTASALTATASTPKPIG